MSAKIGRMGRRERQHTHSATQPPEVTCAHPSHRPPEHTPGPWEVEGVYEAAIRTSYTVTVDGKTLNGLVAIVYERYGKMATNGANARLIAAAPEMLTALRLCERALWELAQAAGQDDDFNDGGPAYEAFTGARALLARIEGGA